MLKKDREYVEYLNTLYTIEEVIEKTEHCWAGNDKTPQQQRNALFLARAGDYGTVLFKYDRIAFNVGFNEWLRERKDF